MSTTFHTEDNTSISGHLETCNASLLTRRYEVAQDLQNKRGDAISGLVSVFDPYVMAYIHSRISRHMLLGNTVTLGIVRSIEDFEINLDEILTGFINIEHDYLKNILIAGGSVVRSLQKSHSVRDLFTDSDVDFYIFGCDTDSKFRSICYWIVRKFSIRNIVITTENAFTFLSTTCKVQIMRKNYSSPQEVIDNFDLDCCCVLYHNKGVLTNVRGLVSLRYRMNVFTSVSTTASRFVKYAYRGYGILTTNVENIISYLHEHCPFVLEHRLANQAQLVRIFSVEKAERLRIAAENNKAIMSINTGSQMMNVMRESIGADLLNLIEFIGVIGPDKITSRKITHEGILFLVDMFDGNYEILDFYMRFFIARCTYNNRLNRDILRCGTIIDTLFCTEWVQIMDEIIN